MAKEEINLTTSLDIAKDLGVHRLTISRIARDNEIGRTIGSTRVFTATEVRKIKKLCKISKGNPNFQKSNKKV